MDRLAGSLASGRFPQAAALTGLPGVGKQRLALWIAQGMLCERGGGGGGGPGVPCGTCGACRRVLGLNHPDLHWFIPIPRPKAGDRDKQVEEAQELLGSVLEERRKTGLWRRPEGMVSHSLASVRLLHKVVWLTPFMGPRKVIILGDAERLVVQEASQEAANALLKVLEEPPADTTVILTTTDLEALLPTIRSRVVPLRVPRVPDDAVRRCLQSELEQPLEQDALERRVLLAEGSIGRALWDEGTDNGDRAATRLLEAVRRGAGTWLPQALSQPPWAARGDFSAMLDALAVRLRGELKHEAEQRNASIDGWLEALERVEATRAEAQGNANPQLALAVLAGDLERAL